MRLGLMVLWVGLAAGNIWDNLYSNQRGPGVPAAESRGTLSGAYHFEVDSGRFLRGSRLIVARNETDQTIQGALTTKQGQALLEFSFNFVSNEILLRLFNDSCKKLSFTSLIRFDFYNLKVLRNFLFFRDLDGTLTLDTPFDVLDAGMPTVRISTDAQDDPTRIELFFVTRSISAVRIKPETTEEVPVHVWNSTSCDQVSDITTVTDELARKVYEAGIFWWERLTAPKPSLVPALLSPPLEF